MSDEFKKLNLKNLLFILVFVLVSSTWISTILVEFSIFYKIILFALLVPVFACVIYFLTRVKVFSLSRLDLIALGIVLFFALFNTFYFHDNFSGNRDDGVFSILPAYITEHHSSTIHNENNIPGWIKMGENNYVSQFYPAYPAYLSIYYALGGFFGIRVSNFLLITIALLAIYLIGKELKNSKAGLFSILLFATSYPMFWFTRRTYTEIIFMSLLWSFAAILFFAYKKRSNLYLFMAVMDLMLLSMIRFEGLIITALVFVFVIFLKFQKIDLSWIKKKKILLLMFILFIPIFIYDLYFDPVQNLITTPVNFYKEASFQVSRAFFQKNPFSQNNQSLPTIGFDNSSRAQLRFHFPEIIILSLSQYNLFLPMLFIPVIFLQIIFFWRKKRNLKLLFIFFMGLQTYVYFTNPYIGLDHPWMLRRYLFFLIPLSYLCFSLFLEDFFSKYKRLLILILFLIIAINIKISMPILFFRENQGMLEKTKELANLFSSNDLLFVDRYVTDRYKIGSSLAIAFGKNSYWVWEGMDCLNLNPSKFENIYLISNPDNLRLKSLFGDNNYLNDRGEFIFPYKSLETTLDLQHIDLPASYGDIYDFDYEYARSLLKVPSKINKGNYNVGVYEIDKNLFRDMIVTEKIICPPSH